MKMVAVKFFAHSRGNASLYTLSYPSSKVKTIALSGKACPAVRDSATRARLTVSYPNFENASRWVSKSLLDVHRGNGPSPTAWYVMIGSLISFLSACGVRFERLKSDESS